MADYGMKIAKAGKNTSSTTIGDYSFWSKYPSLTFMEKKTVQISVTGSGCSGTTNVPFDYDFFPLVIGYVAKTAGNPTDYNNQKYLMPANEFAGISCDLFHEQSLSFTYQINDDSVDIIWSSICIDMGDLSEECPVENATFEVYLYFYMWEMGS